MKGFLFTEKAYMPASFKTNERHIIIKTLKYILKKCICPLSLYIYIYITGNRLLTNVINKQIM
jgi:hypothetical protein